MSEATNTPNIRQADWEAARIAGLLFATPGSSMQDAAIHKFATMIRADLLEALRIAEQFMTIASDWNFDEAEIDGQMRRTYELLDVVRAAIDKATRGDA